MNMRFFGLVLVLNLVATAAAAADGHRKFTVVSGALEFEIEAPLDNIIGNARGIAGAVNVDPTNVASAPTGRIVVDLSSFRTGIDLRDEDLRDQFFQTSKYLIAELELKGLERPSTPALKSGESAQMVIAGVLNFHGVQGAVSIPTTVKFDDGPQGARVRLSGDFVMSLQDFGIKRPSRLLFKLGKDVHVKLNATFRAPPLSAAPDAVVVAAEEDRLPAPSPIIVTRAPPKPYVPTFKFAATTPQGRGERAYFDKKIGGAKNQLTCRSCHATQDERQGLVIGGFIPPNSSVWGAGKRPQLWQGLAASPGAAASLCAKMFMLKDEGLTDATQNDVGAYIDALSADPQVANSFAVMRATRTPPKVLPVGNIARGQKLTQVHCAGCHNKGSVRPELEAGLYERDMLIARVRHLPGTDAQQMPPLTIDRFTDSELADVVAYLTDDTKRIFVRKPSAK